MSEEQSEQDRIEELAAAEPVDTEQLERARQAINEGYDAAAKAMEPPPGG